MDIEKLEKLAKVMDKRGHSDLAEVLRDELVTADLDDDFDLDADFDLDDEIGADFDDDFDLDADLDDFDLDADLDDDFDLGADFDDDFDLDADIDDDDFDLDALLESDSDDDFDLDAAIAELEDDSGPKFASMYEDEDFYWSFRKAAFSDGENLEFLELVAMDPANAIKLAEDEDKKGWWSTLTGKGKDAANFLMGKVPDWAKQPDGAKKVKDFLTSPKGKKYAMALTALAGTAAFAAVLYKLRKPLAAKWKAFVAKVKGKKGDQEAVAAAAGEFVGSLDSQDAAALKGAKAAMVIEVKKVAAQAARTAAAM